MSKTYPKCTLQPGDRIAYAAKFLKQIGAFAGPTPARRGTFVAIDEEMTRLAGPARPGNGAEYARVRWDDTTEAAYKAMAEQYGDDYAAQVREKGSLVLASNIAKVGSPRFALNDL